jgi:hypothetical protein
MLFITAIVAGTVVLWPLSRQAPPSQRPADFGGLLGMTTEEVVNQLGEPDVKNTKPPPRLDYTSWNYDHPAGLPNERHLILHIRDGRVVKVVVRRR